MVRKESMERGYKIHNKAYDKVNYTSHKILDVWLSYIFIPLLFLILIMLPFVMAVSDSNASASNVLQLTIDSNSLYLDNVSGSVGAVSYGHSIVLNLYNTSNNVYASNTSNTSFSMNGQDLSSSYALDMIIDAGASSNSYKYFGAIKFPMQLNITNHRHYTFRLSRISDGSIVSEAYFNYTQNTSLQNIIQNSTSSTFLNTTPNITLDADVFPNSNITTSITNQCSYISMSIDKYAYAIGEVVHISFNNSLYTNLSAASLNTELTISTNDSTYVFVGALSDKVFIPATSGNYTITLRYDNIIVSVEQFVVNNNMSYNATADIIMAMTNVSIPNNGSIDNNISILNNVAIFDNANLLNNISTSNSSIIIKDSTEKKKSVAIRPHNAHKINYGITNATSNITISEYADINLSTVTGFNGAYMRLNTLVMSSNISLSIEDIPKDNIRLNGLGKSMKNNVVSSFAMDLSNLNFTNGTFSKIARGNELWKCKDWNFTEQNCYGTWIKILDISPGQEYTINVSSDDPGFAETSLNIITIQSYPIVGGNWTVAFNTTGIADLSIRAYTPTAWSNINEDNDLKFLGIRCEDNITDYEWINDSVFIANYSCSGISYETSKVLTKGKHTIEFKFGNDTKYAYNNATVPWWSYSWLKRKQLNITNLNNTVTLPKDFSVNITLDTSVANGFLSNGDDFRIVWFNGSTNIELDRFNQSAFNSASTQIWFKLQKNISAGGSDLGYYIYYNNSAASNPPNNQSNIWLWFDDFSGGSIDTSVWTITDATGWSVAGGELKGTSSTGMLTSIATFSSGNILEIKSRYITLPGNGYQIGGFYVNTGNGVGFLNHPGTDYYRNDGNWIQLGTTSPYSTNLSTKIVAKSPSTVDLTVTNYDTGASYQSALNIANTVSSEPIVLGRRYDGSGYLGQAYEAYWDWIRVRTYFTPGYSFNLFGEEFLNISPTISDVQCFVVGKGWENCTSVIYGDNIQHVRANCSSNVGRTIQNATFIFKNINDNRTYFNDFVTEQTDGYWQDGYVNIAVTDSGNFSLSITCPDDLYTNTTYVNWSIPFGTLSVQLINPASNVNVTANRFFSFTSRVSCSGGECGYVNATLDPISWWNYSWTYKKQINLSMISGATPKDYQTRLVLNSSNVGVNWNWSSECVNGVGSRFRFVNGSESVELPYWVENCSVAGQNMIVWVKVDQNITNITNSSIYLYYGNAQAANKSNGTTTFDYFDSGDQISNWTNTSGTGQNTTFGYPAPSYYAVSTSGVYMYRNISLTTNKVVEFNVNSNGLGNFYFLTNSTGRGQHFRAETRGGNNAGIADSTTWTAWSAPSACSNLVLSTWYAIKLTINSTAAMSYINNIACGGAYTVANMGGYIGLIGDGYGAAYTTWWDNIRVRKYSISDPSQAFGNEQWVGNTKDIVPMNSGTPFYTNVSNPMYSNTTSCLANMGDGSTCDTTWYVNATGQLGTTWAFFTIYTPMNYSNNVLAINSNSINITIMNNAAPNVSSIFIVPSSPNYATDLNCNFTINDINTFDTLTANVSWYRNNTLAYSEIIGVSNAVSMQETLSSGNLTAGDKWYCAVTPYDGTSYGAQTNSSNVTILSIVPPVINQIQCQKSGIWGNCSSILYGTVLTAVRVNCTDADGTVTNVTFNFTNVEDSKILFTGSYTNATQGYFMFDNNDTTITDSGTFNLSVSCYDNDNSLTKGYSQWSVPWGKLTAILIDPLTNRSAAQNRYFSFTSRVSCSGGECGYVNATLDPTSPWWDNNWRYKRQINLSLISGSILKGYQLKLFLNSSNVGVNWNWSSECAAGLGSRFRFVNGSESVELPYWVENCSVAGQNMTVWVKVDQAINTSNSSIYLYYGNAQAANKSNGTATFDYFDEGNQLSGWATVGTAGNTSAQGLPIPSYYATSVNGNYLYRDISLTTNSVIEFNVRSDFLGNFFFLTDSLGHGQHFRAEARSGYTSGITDSTSWTAWSAPSACPNIAINTWYSIKLVINSTAATSYINNTACGGAYTVANLGGYIGLVGDAGGSGYTTWWDNLRVRDYAILDPNISYGAEQMTSYKGIIPMNSGTPFYTNVSNPMYSNTTSCLANMGDGSTCDTRWTVNATGQINSTYEFYTTYTSMNYSSYVVENDTPSVYINITGTVPPTISDILCLKNGASWVNCTTIAYGDTITSVKANCSSNMEGSINNVSFMLKNINDNKIYFNTTITNQTNKSWINNNTNLTVNDSGDFNLKVVCIENPNTAMQDVNWSIPFGTLVAQLINPTYSINVTKNKFFNFTVQLTCNGGECGYVNATLDPFPPWWNTSFIYRRQINITESNNTNFSGFQVNLTINTSGLVGSGKMKGDCSDMRFADNNSVELNYFIDSGCNSSSTVVWVRMNLTNNSKSMIFMYYGSTVASAKSNASKTFDLFDDFSGGSIDTSVWSITDATGWSVSGGELKGNSSTGMLTSIATFSSGSILEIKSRYITIPTNGYQIGGFYVNTGNSIGYLNHPGNDYYRNDGGWTALPSTSPPSTNLSTRITVKTAALVDLTVTNYDNGTSYQSALNIANAVSSEPVVLGRRYDGSSYLGQAYEAYWDWIRVRKYAAQIPTQSALGAEEVLAKGDIPMGSGTPFYTISQNPTTSLNTSCLGNMLKGNSCNITWAVNATGDAGSTWEFYVTFGLMNYSSNINAINSTHINITITANSPPNVTSIAITPASPTYFTNLYCNFTVMDANYFDTLTANVSWFKNNVLSYSENVTVSNGVSTQRVLNSSNLTAGQVWYCAVTPYDGTSYGNQVNSSNVTISSSLPPAINSIQCQENNAAWGACSNVLYADNMTAVRTNCTAFGGTIANATFKLSNIEHNLTYFTGTVNTTSAGYFVFDNNDMNINNSGTYNLSVICIDVNGTSGSNYTSWLVPWGTLSSQLMIPNTSTNVTYNRFFNFTAQITCNGGECGYVSAALDPSAAWWNTSWIFRKNLNVTENSNTNFSGFQVNFTINTSGLVGAGKMKGDCSDMRFVDNNSVELNYFMVSGCNSSSTVVWVRMNLTANNKTNLFMYYGNPSAVSKSNATKTFDLFDDFSGGSIDTSVWSITDATGWSVSGGELKGTSSTGVLTSLATFSSGNILEIKSRYITIPTNGYQIGGFFIDTGNSIGFLNHPTTDYYRNDGNWIQLGTTSPSPVNLSTKIVVKSPSTVDLTVTNYDTGSSYQSALDIANTVSSEPVVLGRRYDGSGYLGQAYEAYWDWIRVRKYASTMPTVSSFGTEEQKPKGDIPMGSGTPFYTISQNPTTSLNTSCLGNMLKDNSCSITWKVNATGDIGTTWVFYVIYNSMNFSSYISPINSSAINITIMNITAPSISSISLTPVYPTVADNLNCTFTEVNSAPLDPLTANVTWYRNNAYYSSSIVSVVSGISTIISLGSGNLTLGNTWICGVTPLNQGMVGAQVNSSNVTVLSSTPPSINQVQCLINGSIWQNCSSMAFGDILSGVRANCTNNNPITNVSFNLTNIPDAYNFFTNTTASNISDWWIFYTNMTINNSGEYRLYTSCYNNLSGSFTTLNNWTIPWGRFVINLVNPNVSINVPRYQFFNFTVNVTCVGGECGDVNATVDPMTWWNSAWKYRLLINISERNNTALNNYQVNLSINTSSLISAGKMKSDCSDIRFADKSSNELIYYTASGCNTTSTNIWLRANLTAGANTTVYLYYGNPSAVSKSNASATFDLFDDFSGGSIDTSVWTITDATGWSVAGGELEGTSNTGRLTSIATFSSGYILEIKSRYITLPGNGYQIGGFFANTGNGVGFLNHPGTDYYRNDGGWTAMATTSPSSVNLSTRIVVKSSSLVDIAVTNYDNGTSYQNVTNIANTVSSEPIALGKRYDDAIVGQTYEAYWDWIRVRKYVAIEPSYATYSEEIGKSDISTVVGATPFYTITNNPMDYTTTACLKGMIAGNSCQVNWAINATGSANSTWDFFAYFNSTTYPGYVLTNQSKHINITIFDSVQVPPVTTLVYPNNSYYTNNATVIFNCSATDNTGLSNMTLYLKYKLGLFLPNGTNNLGGIVNSTIFSRQLQEGTYVWNCLAYDIDGNPAWSPSNRTLTVDATAPTIALSTPGINATFTFGTVILNFSTNDNLDSSLFCNLTIDSSVAYSNMSTTTVTTSWTVSNLGQGTHYWNVSCMDHAGNVNISATRPFIILGFLPNVTLITPDNYTQMSTTINLQYNATDYKNISNASLYINGVLNMTNTTVVNSNISAFTVSGLAEGKYNWTVNVTDSDGLTTQAPIIVFIIDYTNPRINISAPADNTTINITSAYFNFTVYDNINQSLNCNITVNNIVKIFNTSAQFSVLTSKQITNLSNGINYWNVTCWDKAGNTNTSNTWKLNVSSPPTILINFPSDNYSQNSSTFAFNYTPTDASGFSKCELYINGLLNQTNSTAVQNGQPNIFTLSGVVPGKYNWTINCTDTIGIQVQTLQRSFIMDILKPTILLYAPQPNETIYGQNVMFNYTATDDFSQILNCNLTLDNSVTQTNISSQNGVMVNISISISNQGIHYWNVTCSDGAGNVNTSSSRNFTIKIPPTVALYSPNMNQVLNYSQNVIFTYTPTDASGLNGSILIFNGVTNQSNSTGLANGFPNTFTVNMSDGFYTWTVNATNMVGLTGTATARNLTIDTTPPVVIYSHPNNSETMTWNNITFNFTATDNLAATMVCNVTINSIMEYSNMTVINGTPVIFNKVLNDGNYNWSVTCLDNANWTNSYTLINFSVAAPPNVTLNWPISYYRTNATNITFNYTPRDAIGIQNCTLFYDGLINTTEIMIQKNQPDYFTIANQSQGGHNWTVRCIDLAPDLNSYTPPAEFFIIDLTPPNMTLSRPYEGEFPSGNNIQFNWTAVDFNGTYVSCSLFVDGFFNKSMASQLSGSVFTTTLTNMTNGPHNWSVNCSDDLGNFNMSITQHFTINQPDLYIDSSRILFNNTNPVMNQSINISANVSNIGATPANNLLVNFYDGDPALGGVIIGNSTGAVSFNSSMIFSILWNITVGYHTIYVAVDPYNAIAELNETNNNATKNISLLKSAINSPINGAIFNNSSIAVNFTLQDFTTGQINYSFIVDNVYAGPNGTAVDNISSVYYVNLTQGLHSIKVEALDVLGRRRNSSVINITIDYTAPNATILTANNSWFNYATPIINITATDNIATNISYKIYVNGSVNSISSIVNGTTSLINLSTLAGGYYQIIMEVADTPNNTANSTPKYIYVDLTPPNINLTSPANGTNYTVRTVVLNYTTSDNLAFNLSCSLTLDGSIVASQNVSNGNSSNYTVNNLIEGTHYWNVTCQDQANNTNTSQTNSFNVYMAPVITLLNPTNNNWSNSGNNTFTLNVSDETGLQNCSMLLNGIINQTKTTAQLVNNATNNFTISGMVSGNYTWAVSCYDNTTYHTYNVSSNRTLYVDLILPQSYIQTANNTWFNTGTPSIIFNITDNMADTIDYTFYVNGTPNTVGTVTNNTGTSTSLTGLQNGTYSVILGAVDKAGNMQNSTPIILYVDSVVPIINLTYPPNGANITTTVVNLNFTPTDNMASYMICNVTLDGSLVGLNLNVSSGAIQNVTWQNLVGGNHYWNVTCIDMAGNKNVSQTNSFYILMPDLYIDNTSIYLSNLNPVENDTINITATIKNKGNVNATNFSTEIRLNNPLTGTLILNATLSVPANQSVNITANYTMPVGDTIFYVLVDTPLATNGTIKEENESNNNASRSLHVGLWEYVVGTTTDTLAMMDLSNQTIFSWLVSNATGSKLFATDMDSNINWRSLKALGINASNQSSPTDFCTLDTKLGSSNFSDSVNKTYTSGGSPIETVNYTLFARPVVNIPIVNSTNNSNFKTGILWDYSTGSGKYDGSQSIVFVSQIQKSTYGYNATEDYEIRVPATLRSYKSGVDAVALYAEIN